MYSSALTHAHQTLAASKWGPWLQRIQHQQNSVGAPIIVCSGDVESFCLWLNTCVSGQFHSSEECTVCKLHCRMLRTDLRDRSSGTPADTGRRDGVVNDERVIQQVSA